MDEVPAPRARRPGAAARACGARGARRAVAAEVGAASAADTGQCLCAERRTACAPKAKPTVSRKRGTREHMCACACACACVGACACMCVHVCACVRAARRLACLRANGSCACLNCAREGFSFLFGEPGPSVLSCSLVMRGTASGMLAWV